jgi:hypothetical protein
VPPAPPGLPPLTGTSSPAQGRARLTGSASSSGSLASPGLSDPAAARSAAGGTPRPDQARTAITRTGTDRTAPPAPGRSGELVPVAGLAGLVSWWEARDETPSDEAGIVPATTPPAAAWSVADTPHEAPRTAEGAFESSPAVRLSLRTALEELLLAEARASGIEVDP